MNHTSQYDLTIIVPVYNEEAMIDRLESAMATFLPDCLCRACVLFVNDGSTDQSLAGLTRICASHPDFFYASFAQNRGLSAALKAGFDLCQSRYVGYIDADLQTHPEDFNLLLAHIEEDPLVIGIRVGRKDTWSKRMQSKIANGFRRMMTGDTATDTGCPLKVIRTDYAKRIPMFTGMHRFLPALIMLQDGGTFQEIPVHHYPRTAGVSKYHLWNRLISPLKDCFAYRWMKHRYINYRITADNLSDPVRNAGQ